MRIDRFKFRMELLKRGMTQTQLVVVKAAGMM